MGVLSFLGVSSLEWFALLMLSFTMFRMEIRGSRGQIAFTSFLLSLLSYILIVRLDLVTFATFLQPPIVFLFLWLMFRIPAFYAGVITTNGYLIYILLTAIIYGIAHLLGLQIVADTPASFAAQTLTACIALSIARFLHTFRLGYTFVPYRARANERLTKPNLRLLLVTIAGYAVITSFNFLYFLGDYKQAVLIPVIVSLALLQYGLFKKESADSVL
ncbi:hypothetical protein [Paenibacillus ginsengarvi]|uniref:Uncharacterized protein n=1 Tax=Paenibacillus ginsengarvi TaxID=400777 RepID=A0A3B0BXQ3_9BACL|nr:hypothetical protein [Paenibacillus ginsengarvi]RKN77168.1 hypothetical protein D7M11_24425 [Paenibacillus ginsengarvi]